MMHQSIVEISENLFLSDSLKTTREWLMSSQRASRANRSPQAERDLGQKTRGTNGQQLETQSKSSGQNTCSLKMFQVSQGLPTSLKSAETLPPSGMMQDGLVWELMMSEPHTKESDSGSWLTPINQEGRQAYQQRPEGKKGSQINLTTQVKNTFGLLVLWNRISWENQQGFSEPTRDVAEIAEIIGAFNISAISQIAGAPPMKSIARTAMNGLTPQIQEFVSGAVAQTRINQDWMDWLMGLPVGWTDSRPLETDKFRQWFRRHGKS
jgi:hypothetical protein